MYFFDTYRVDTSTYNRTKKKGFDPCFNKGYATYNKVHLLAQTRPCLGPIGIENAEIITLVAYLLEYNATWVKTMKTISIYLLLIYYNYFNYYFIFLWRGPQH